MSLSKIDHFHFPANLTEMSAEQEVLYSNTRISQWMDDEIAGNVQGPDGKNRTPLSNFFNGRKTEFDPSATHTVHWQAFPKRVSDFWGLNTTIAGSKYLLRWAVADSSRIYQDEYLEWSVAREPINVKTGLRIPDPSPNPINKQGDFNCDITSISFTCEGPEYWQFFTAQKPEEIVAMYKKYNASIDDPLLTAAQTIFLPFGDGTDLDSLYKKGVYNPCNNYNFTSTSGTIMHLIHPSNTLGAEVDIAAQGTVIRKKDGAIITDPDALINCSKYGNLHRNSDPKIGSEINTAVIGNKAITVQDPVALYMQNPDLSFLQLDYSPARDGSDLRDIPPGTINFTRGDWANNRGLRIDIAVPNTEKTSDGKRQLNVSDIFDTSPDKQLYIHYAAQIADYLEIAVTVNLISREAPEPQACPGAPQASVTALGTQMTVAGEEPERKAFLSTRRF